MKGESLSKMSFARSWHILDGEIDQVHKDVRRMDSPSRQQSLQNHYDSLFRLQMDLKYNFFMTIFVINIVSFISFLVAQYFQNFLHSKQEIESILTVE